MKLDNGKVPLKLNRHGCRVLTAVEWQQLRISRVESKSKQISVPQQVNGRAKERDSSSEKKKIKQKPKSKQINILCTV